jgi:hypothetical protein
MTDSDEFDIDIKRMGEECSHSIRSGESNLIQQPEGAAVERNEKPNQRDRRVVPHRLFGQLYVLPNRERGRRLL